MNRINRHLSTLILRTNISGSTRVKNSFVCLGSSINCSGKDNTFAGILRTNCLGAVVNICCWFSLFVFSRAYSLDAISHFSFSREKLRAFSNRFSSWRAALASFRAYNSFMISSTFKSSSDSWTSSMIAGSWAIEQIVLCTRFPLSPIS
jgi:hypothetical protein